MGNVTVRSEGKPVVWRRVPYDVQRLKDPRTAQLLRLVSKLLPVLPWRVHASDALALQSWFLREAARTIAPLRRCRQRKSWLAASTYELVLSRSRLRTKVANLKAAGNEAMLQLAIAALQETRRDVRKAVRADKNAWRSQVIAQMQEAHVAGDSRALYQKCKLLMPYKERAPQMVLLESGLPAPNASAARGRWFRHFAGVLHAKATSLDHIAGAASEMERSNFAKLAVSGEFDLTLAPPPSYIATRLAKRKQGRAAGTDGIVGELQQGCAAIFRHTSYAMALKAAWALAPPLAMRGGSIVELWKAKGSAALCSNYRDVSIKDLQGKDVSAWWRSKLRPYLEQATGDTAFGGLHGRGADLMAHISRLHWQVLRARGRCGSQLFVDLSTAFASVMRQLAFSHDEAFSDEMVASILTAFSMPAEAMADVRRIVASPDALSEARVALHCRLCVQTMHESTWFLVQGHGQAGCSGRGTQAGDPLGDAVFIVIYTRVCRAARQRLLEAGCLFSVSHDRSLPPWASAAPPGAAAAQFQVADGAYLDDSLFMQEAVTAHSLLPQVEAQISIIYSVFTLHGLKVNMSAGKTECLLRVVGPGKKQVLRSIHSCGGVIFQTPFDGSAKLVVGKYYKHMGCLTRPDGRVASEISHRVGETRSALRGIASSILSAHGLDTGVKLQAVGGFVLSRLLYNAGSWPPLSGAEVSKIQAARSYAWRSILREHNAGRGHGDRSTDLTIRQTLRQCTVGDLLAAQRLRHLRRILVAAPEYLLGLVQTTTDLPDAWGRLIQADLVAMSERAQDFRGLLVASLPDPLIDFDPWRRLIIDRPVAWSSAITKLFIDHGGRFEPAAEECPEIDPATEISDNEGPAPSHQCQQCHKSFRSASSLASHCARAHGYRNTLRDRIDTLHCCRCLKMFWTRERLLYHAKRSSRCRQFYLSGMPLVGGHELDQEAAKVQRANIRAGFQPRHAEAPCTLLHGPRPRQFHEPPRSDAGG